MIKTTKHQKWCLHIDGLDVNMPTKEHAIKMGKYLQTFNVPVKIVEVNITVDISEPGKANIVGKERISHNNLLKQDPTNNS